MAGELKNRVHYGVTLDKKLVIRLRELSESTKIPQSKLMDEALEILFRKYEKESK